MPPLAHLLAPQIMAKARQIEAELGPPQVGYLAQQNVQAPGVDAQGNRIHPGRAMLNGIDVMQKSGDPIAQKVAKGFLAGVQGKLAGAQGGMYRAPQAGQAVDPYSGKPTMTMLAPVLSASEPIGFTESGEAIYEAPKQGASFEKPGRKLQLKKDQAVGIDETGESVDRKGKKMGYLATPGAPMGTTDTGNGKLPLKNLARHKTDAPMDKRDKFGAGALIELYAPHLKAMQDRFQDTGREEFPPGYFNGMTPQQQQDIEIGVKTLRDSGWEHSGTAYGTKT